MSDSRPVNLDLTSISLPLSAYASILHRVSAVIIWVGFAALLAIVGCATQSEESFNDVVALLSGNFLVKFCIWGFLTALGYYCAATVKHLVQDFGYCEELESGKVISGVAIGAGVVLAVLAGVVVW